MPLNGTQPEQAAKAGEELAKKVRLESKFTSDLSRLFRRVSVDLGNALSETGGTVSANNYTNDLKIILNRNYKRVQKSFIDEIIQFLKENRRNLQEDIILELSMIAEIRGIPLTKMIQQMRKAIVNDLTAFRNFNVQESVELIIGTTQKEIDKAVTKATAKLIEETGEQPTRGQLAKETRKEFFARQLKRSSMIAATETQKAAEGAKQIERDNLLAVRNGAASRELELDPIKPKEIWVTQADSLVRDGQGTVFNHLAADGMPKENGVFTVSNELLRFPGDISLGASPGNVIRCRCSAVTVIN